MSSLIDSSLSLSLSSSFYFSLSLFLSFCFFLSFFFPFLSLSRCFALTLSLSLSLSLSGIVESRRNLKSQKGFYTVMVSGCMPSGTREKAGASKHRPLSGPLDHFFPVHPQLAIKLDTHNSFFISIFFFLFFIFFLFYLCIILHLS